MNATTTNPHNQAMDLVETAILERTRDHDEKAVQLYAEALEVDIAAVTLRSVKAMFPK